MSELTIKQEEIEKMLCDQLGCDSVSWDAFGNAIVELDLTNIIRKAKEKLYETPWGHTHVSRSDSNTITTGTAGRVLHYDGTNAAWTNTTTGN